MDIIKGEVVLAMDRDEARKLRDALISLGDYFERVSAREEVDGDHPLVATLEPRMRLSILLGELERNVR